ncbi:MAG: glycosyltransferase family 1 protein [Bacteroidales bacterium]
MKIAIEAQRIFRINKHGMDFVILEALKQLQKLDTFNEYFVFVSGGDDKCLSSTKNMHIIELKCTSYPLWEQIVLPRAVKKVKADILHCTSNTAPLFCGIPLILTLHDIIFLEKRQNASKSLYQNLGWYYRKFIVPRILPKCKKIITVSKFECERIRTELGLDPNKIIAIYNGYNSHFKPIKDYYEITKQYLPEKEYLFFLGNTDPKKNTLRTLVAYSIYLKQSSVKLPLLIADLREDIVDAILKEAAIENIKPYLRFGGYIKNTSLPYIYSGAKAFIYTSLRESFGIPILEGMACGTPVITSNISAMPEIAGERAILTDPFNSNSIALEIIRLEQDKEFYTKQVRYGLERVKFFSWESTAKQMLELYKQQ